MKKQKKKGLKKQALALKDGRSSKSLPIAPSERKAGWINYGDRVVLICPVDGGVFVKTGHICSTPGSHLSADNIKSTVVWGDNPFNDCADSADDAYEKSVQVDDPCLLRLDEAIALKENRQVATWLSGHYPHRTAECAQRIFDTKIAGFNKDGHVIPTEEAIQEERKMRAAEAKVYQELDDAFRKRWGLGPRVHA